MDGNDVKGAGKCPVMHGANTAMGKGVMDWWPKSLNLDILSQHDTKVTPLTGFAYREEVKKLEAEIGDGTLSLNAFILSETNFGDLINTSRVNRADLEARNVLFMEASGTSYIDRMIEGLS